MLSASKDSPGTDISGSAPTKHPQNISLINLASFADLAHNVSQLPIFNCPFMLSPLDVALTPNPLASPLESVLTKNSRGWVSQRPHSASQFQPSRAILAALSFQTLTNRSFSNPFVFRTIPVARGGGANTTSNQEFSYQSSDIVQRAPLACSVPLGSF